jgi:tetratricopeptide (TPR) repeat protein
MSLVPPQPVVSKTGVVFGVVLSTALWASGFSVAEAAESSALKLGDDGRIGKLNDAQGVVLVKPVMRERWTPVDHPTVLMPGDWLRTDKRGANAVTVRLVTQVILTLGPGTLVELAGPERIRITEGEIKLAAPARASIDLLGPGEQAVKITGTQLYRVHNAKLVKVAQEPAWLKYYEGKTSNESIGSLVAKVEGRNVPLSVGFHKVTVDIRDQIARTVIEESFVNHTQGTLEGVFYFPLPQDASISGFGMWIGDRLVEADIVEKQRARDIYETILRERRDPGLLEWSGGSLFKARVFPILGNSEKRITINYTQVLPLRGNRYRYQYALQSELLKQHPLRELSIGVKVSSALPLSGVASPTHPARIDRTTHSAHVEFSAQEYTPNRDFEVVVEVDPRQSGVVLIPHRRGDDGYFLAQLTPPGSTGQWQRELLPDGRPIELLILADTSASMDAGSRAAQAQLVCALLASLTAKDTFNLAVCDLDCRWVFDKPRAADPKNVAAARELLAGRASLGWSDLDKAFASAIGRSGAKSHVVYIGDGIPTTGDGDPVALAQRLKRLYQGHAGTFHAVAVSASFEPVVLKAIASLGGGSMRQVGGDRGPQTVAAELLAEMVQPGLRDLKVEFRGLPTARVYPQELPNLPAGSQQILLGRYLPVGWVSDPSSNAPVGRIANPSCQANAQSGEVILTATQDGKPVRFTSKVTLKDAEQGNSFIPRLWARMHLDALLAQGTSQAVQDDIIALSEQYHIITPYTSLLVLESDADRERFKVKRCFQIRDGEKFFADGRENVNYDLVQKQMRAAAGWRLGLRRDALAQLARLGRDPQLIDAIQGLAIQAAAAAGETPHVYGYHGFAGFGVGGGMMGGMGMGGFGRVAPFQSNLSLDVSQTQEVPGLLPQFGGYEPEVRDSTAFARERQAVSGRDEEGTSDKNQPEAAMEEVPVAPLGDLDQPTAPRGSVNMESFATPPATPLFCRKSVDFASRMELITSTIRPRPWGLSIGSRINGNAGVQWDTDNDYDGAVGGPLYSVLAGTWLDGLFPNFAPPMIERKKREPGWPAEARLLARSLLRTETLARLSGGMEITTQTESFDPRWNELTGRSRKVALVSPSAWLLRTQSDGSETTVDWCDRNERGVLSKAFELGRHRAPAPRELASPPLELDGFWVLKPLDEEYADYTVDVKTQGGDRTLLILKLAANIGASGDMRILVDTARHVVLRIESWQNGKLETTTRFSDFVEVAGAWWAGRIEAVDQEGRIENVTVQRFSPLTSGAFGQRFQQELVGRDRVQFLREPLPKLAAAKRNLRAGKPTFEDRVVLMAHFERSQQWARVMEHLRGAERLAAGKPGVRWLRATVLASARKREEWKKGATEEAARIAGPQGTLGDYTLAEHLVNEGDQVLEANEKLALLDLLRPVYERQPPHVDAIHRWGWHRTQCLEQTDQSQEVVALCRELADRFPHDAGLQEQYARQLAKAGDCDAALARLNRALSAEARWNRWEENQLRKAYVEILREQGRYPELADWLAARLNRSPPPESDELYHQYLTALIRADRVDQANGLIAQWIKEAQEWSRLPETRIPVSERPLPVGAVSGLPVPQVRLRAQAAIAQALGRHDDGDSFADRAGWIEPRWLEPLAETALTFAQNEAAFGLAGQIMNDDRFRETDQARRVRKIAAQRLRAEFDKLASDQVAGYVEWLLANNPPIDAEGWKHLADRLRRRWGTEKEDVARDQLAESLLHLLSKQARPENVLEFLRERVAKAPKDYRVERAGKLFDTLLEQPWKPEYEAEAIGLLEQLSDAEEPAVRLASQVAALHKITDRMVQARYDARMKAVEHPQKLTRLEMAAKRRESLRAAREGFADRLRQEMPKHSPALAYWMNIERLYLDVLTRRNLEEVAEECWKFLGPEPRRTPDDEKPATLLEETLRQRYLITLLHVTIRKTAKSFQKAGLVVQPSRLHPVAGETPAPQGVERVTKYLDRAIAVDPENDRPKFLKVQFLIALDRPKELEATLRAWIEAGDPDHRWGAALGYLAAEQGRLQEAIERFEAIRAQDELGPAEHRALANWYMAVGRRQEYRRAMIDLFKTTDESGLTQWLSEQLRPWEQATGADPFSSAGGEKVPLPSELDAQVPLVFTALLEKASQPQQHLPQIQQFYHATHDFRLLAALVDSVVGHTAGTVYPLLEGLGPLLKEVRDEATVDSIVERIAEVRKRAPSAVDQRALDLVEVLAERRAAELQDQPQAHADRALAALRRALTRQWSPGEPRLMAGFLAALDAIAYRPLAEAQIRALEALHRDAANRSEDRMHIALRLANGYWAYQRPNEAIDLLETALGEYQAGQGGILPMSANDSLDKLVSYLEQRGQFANGEKLLQEQLKHPVNQQQIYWLTEHLDSLYGGAVCKGGSVSLGSGAELYRAVNRKIQADMDVPNDKHRQNLVEILLVLYSTAKQKHTPDVADDVRLFAFKRLPLVLKRQRNEYETIVGHVAQSLHGLAGPRDALAFLIERIEQEPAWLRLNNRDGWSQHGAQLAQWFAEVKELGDLEERLLNIVTNELRRDLESRQGRHRNLYAKHHGGPFWAAKAGIFAQIAEAVLARHKDSIAQIVHVADYLHTGLEYTARAVEILLDAHRRGVLDEHGKSQLAKRLIEQKRFAESIPVLEPLVRRRPDDMENRTMLMRAYCETSQRDKLLAALEATDAHFHKEDRWQENAIAALALSCLENRLYQQAVGYYQEAISLHRRIGPGGGIDTTIPQYCKELAQAFAGLGKTSEAVEALCAAVVSWGPHRDQRAEILRTLDQLLRQSPDLDGYVARLDQETARTGLDNPILRKALGMVYAGKSERGKAIGQLKLAADLQPNDPETWEKLIECRDRLGDKEGAIRDLLHAAQLSRRNIRHYEDVGNRLKALGRPDEAERAYTSLVEMLPSESEGHALLAEIRQHQNRWAEAIAQWEQVARLRALEPTGLVKLAEAQIHERRWADAQETVRKLASRPWPPRFGDVDNQIQELQDRVRARGKE